MPGTDRPIPDPKRREGNEKWWPPKDWPERIERAKEAQRAGKRLRENKPVTFPEQR